MINEQPKDSIDQRARKNGRSFCYPSADQGWTDAGMTLREYLAAQAIAGCAWMVRDEGSTAEVIAANAVELADAVLLALELGPDR